MAELLAGILVGNYFLLECIAHEGMVETYRARPTTRGGYDVVLRLFKPEFPDPTSFRAHFSSEVEKVWRCRHTHIQPLLEFGAGDDLLYCSTLFSDETISLENYLARQHERTLPIPLALHMVTQICAALQYAHEQEIVHGNLQPASILVAGDGNVSLTHFGMKRAYREGEPLVSQIGEGNAAYAAPEQALGMILPAGDIYALGVLLYRLLGGAVPYDGEESGEIALKHTNDPLPSLRALCPEIPEALELVVRVALAKSPEARFQNPSALALALRSAVAEYEPQVVSATPPPPSTPSTPTSLPTERRIPVRPRRTRFAWSQAATFLTMVVLLFSLMGASLFIFSLPHGIADLQRFPFWFVNQSGLTGRTPGTSPPQSKSTVTTGGGATTIPGVTPTTGSKTPTPATPTTISQTPIVVGTVVPTPTPTPIVACVSGSLSINGSPNLEPLLQQVDTQYQTQCAGMTIALSGNGSRVALNLVQQNRIDVAASDLTARSTRNLTDNPIAAMLYVVITNPDVQLTGLSSTDLQGIYQGQITNWSQVGGPDEPITVIQHVPADTASVIFRTFVLGGQTEHVQGLRMRNGWAQVVAQIPGAISYVPLLDVQGSSVFPLAIDGAMPTIQGLLDGTYQFWSVEHLYTQGSGTAQFQAYLPFLNSQQEIGMFAQYGAIAARIVPQSILATHLPGPEL